MVKPILAAISGDLSTCWRPLVAEAERLYDLLCILSQISIGADHWERVHRITRRAGIRRNRRMLNAPCDGCGKPATRTVTTFTGSDMETRRPVYLTYCEACYHELYGEGDGHAA
jgi:hypothetical protein